MSLKICNKCGKAAVWKHNCFGTLMLVCPDNCGGTVTTHKEEVKKCLHQSEPL